ncbi:amidase family protein [Fodinicurvata sp. EGI_FJ10296]|uniref:amidase n=1 Tax=Fodinicurvata sp. EGI_FJ10296 TaxID=3231908 RepID=UPI0034543000
MTVPTPTTAKTPLCTLDAVTLRGLIGRKEISPVEVLESFLAQRDRLNPAVNAMVAQNDEVSRAEAKAAERAVLAGDRLGPLHGLPIGIKDLTATKDLVTTYGSLVHRDNVPAADSGVVARLREAGAIVMGKTNTPEFGAGAQTVNKVYGPTRNPFDTSLTCAGSSGGSAVALATDMVALATGSDMGGSLRTPAAFCGVTGFRPSPGAIANEGRRHGWATLSVDGPMGRTVADTALMYDAMAGSDPRDPLSVGVDRSRLSGHPPVDLSSLRVAFSPDLGFAPVSGSIRETFRDRADRLTPLFGEARWAHPDLGDAEFAFEVLRAVGFVDNYGALVDRHGETIGANVRTNVTDGRRYTIGDVGRAQALQTEILRRCHAFWQDIDVLICPAAAVSPFPIDQLYIDEIDGQRLNSYIHWIAITYGITVTTHPSVVLPCGRDSLALPFGLQVVGPRGGDGVTLAAAAALEAAFAGDPVLKRPIPAMSS